MEIVIIVKDKKQAQVVDYLLRVGILNRQQEMFDKYAEGDREFAVNYKIDDKPAPPKSDEYVLPQYRTRPCTDCEIYRSCDCEKKNHRMMAPPKSKSDCFVQSGRLRGVLFTDTSPKLNFIVKE